MTATEPAHLLWTSGWDSTYRLLELLLRTDRVIVPHYVIDTERVSLAMELLTMERIIGRLRKDFPEESQRLRPHRFILRCDIAENSEVSRDWKRLRESHELGTQYDYLARYALALEGIRLELGVIGSVGKASRLLRQHMTRKGDTWVLLEDSPAELRIFRPFEFPIIQLSKPDMGEEAKKMGVYDILMMSWFCHSPRGRQPCAACVPCMDAMKMGMGFRVPFTSRLRRQVSAFFPKSN